MGLSTLDRERRRLAVYGYKAAYSSSSLDDIDPERRPRDRGEGLLTTTRSLERLVTPGRFDDCDVAIVSGQEVKRGRKSSGEDIKFFVYAG
jgi:hypothetical protein